MIIACDCDNVINNLQKTVISIFNQRHNTEYTLEDFCDYDIANTLPIEEAAAMKRMYGENGIYKKVVPMSYSRDGLKKLISAGHQVYIVSDTLPHLHKEKYDWIRHYFPFIDEEHIITMKHKHLFRCDIMIEDNMQNLLASPYYDRICLDYPWNKAEHEDYIYDVYRCRNWPEIVDAVNKINEKASDV